MIRTSTGFRELDPSDLDLRLDGSDANRIRLDILDRDLSGTPDHRVGSGLDA